MYQTAARRAPIGTKARTGETCPESGVWRVEGTPSTTAPISKGNRMPPYGNRAVTWVLVQYA
ncbi:hypothetical protein DC522_12825 [Microvirga sp. KLBC 81]|nr:hypothetical protein DC522_12825 [Microvirga sp. KLBC 81]